MKTEYKHIHFEDISNLFPKRKTETWDCRSSAGISLGDVYWNCGWRQYCFYPEQDRVFSKSCLIDICDFIYQLMENCKKKEGRRNAEEKKRQSIYLADLDYKTRSR